MHFERYTYQRAKNGREYDFYSEGPKGRIRKMVRFHSFYMDGLPYYNLTLGDWNEERKSIDHRSITNNGDAEKVLVTVTAIVADFANIFEEAAIYAEGSTMARTRRYQIGINNRWDEISDMFYVYGRRDGQWEPFRKNVNYDAFLASRIECITLREQTESYMKQFQKPTLKWWERHPGDKFDVDMPDLSNDPYVIKKAEAARKSLEKTGVPRELEELLKRRRR